MNFLALATIHDWVPSTPPLPDVVLSNIPQATWALDVCEVLLILLLYSALVLILAHKHR